MGKFRQPFYSKCITHLHKKIVYNPKECLAKCLINTSRNFDNISMSYLFPFLHFWQNPNFVQVFTPSPLDLSKVILSSTPVIKSYKFKAIIRVH